MLQFQIVVNTLKINDGINTIFSISKKDVYYIQTTLNEEIPKISLYNVNVGVFAVVFQSLLSNCLDPNGEPFTVETFTDFAENNLGFNSDGASSSITVTESYETLPDATTVSGQFYWCENTDGTFPVGLYYSDGTIWQFQGSENTTVVANYSALPNPTTVSGQFYWCESMDGTFPIGLYYSNGTVWQFQISDNITVVANYSALPNPTTVIGQFFWAEASQGTSWLPANLGGTYYSAGMYYSNGISWSFINVPYQATQSEVNSGINTDKFVTPNTLENFSKWANIQSQINDKQNALGFTPENINNKSSSYTVSSTTTYANTKALVDGLATKQASLGYTPYRFISIVSSVTGTVAETVVGFETILGGTFNANDNISMLSRFIKPITLSNVTLRIRTSPNNVPLSATQIAIFTFPTTNTFATFSRNFPLLSGLLSGYNFTSSIANDVTPTTTVGSSTSFNPLITNYFYFTIQLGNIADSINPNLCKLSN